MSFREDALKARVEAVRPKIAKARELAELAESEHREFTGAEQKEFDSLMVEGRSVADALKQKRHDDSVWEFARDLAGVTGGIGESGGSLSGDKGRRLSFKGMGSQVAAKMLPDGTKALAPSGAAVVGQEFKPDPVALGQPATALLDVLPTVQHSTPEFAYLRQTTRTNAAAVVDENATKPTSVYSVTRVEASLVVVAHLSEPIVRFWIEDNISLDHFIESELQYGLGLAVEAKLLADINATSGIQTEAYATSVLTTLRKGITKLEVSGYTPASIVLHPTDFEGIELALSSVPAIETRGLPYDPAARQLFGVPIVSTVSQTAGVGHVLAVDAVAVDTDTAGVGVLWSETSNSDDFAKNLIRARCEGRFATSVYSPLGVVTADLTA